MKCRPKPRCIEDRGARRRRGRAVVPVALAAATSAMLAMLAMLTMATFAMLALGADSPKGLPVHQFATDPGWEGYRNRLVPDPPRRTRQAFGYQTTHHAGGDRPGEIGGWIQRSLTPARYAMAIKPRTLNDKLTASGRFAVTRDDGGTGVLIGWFNDDRSRGWRTPSSIAMRLDGNGARYWVFYEYGTQHWLTGGGGAFQGDRYQTTVTKPLPADGTPHRWTLTYDPQGHGGDGELTLVLDARTYAVALEPGHKADGATFNRFGIWNQQTYGDGMEAWFDDLVVDGAVEHFDRDPGWRGEGNETEFAERGIRPLHDFGYRPTRYAGGRGGQPGEIGGLIWRDEPPAYYGDRVGRLTLNDELYASGKIAFTAAGSDSGAYLGWFDSTAMKNKKPSDPKQHEEHQKNILGVLIEGPSRIGHYIRPAYRASDGQGRTEQAGPIIRPDAAVHDWSIHYMPGGGAGPGRITVTFDQHVQTLDLVPAHRRRGAAFDRFGLFNMQTGGHYVRLYVDDLSYTKAAAPAD